jgi:hypothetical protein
VRAHELRDLQVSSNWLKVGQPPRNRLRGPPVIHRPKLVEIGGWGGSAKPLLAPLTVTFHVSLPDWFLMAVMGGRWPETAILNHHWTKENSITLHLHTTLSSSKVQSTCSFIFSILIWYSVRGTSGRSALKYRGSSENFTKECRSVEILPTEC